MHSRSRTLWILAIALVVIAGALLYPATRARLGHWASGIAPESVQHHLHTLTGPQPKAWVRRIEFPEGELTSRHMESLVDEPTATSAHFRARADFLPPGRVSLRPHKHVDDELIVPLEGELEVLLTDSHGPWKERIGPGKFVFNAANQPHGLSSSSDKRASYLVFKWEGRNPKPFEAEVRSDVLNFGKAHRHHLKDPPERFEADTIFEGPTRHLRKLHSHASTLMPGAGYDPQEDDMDIAMVLVRGKVETLGEQVEAPAMFFYPAGHPHGLRNVGEEPAQYIVFEFHGR